MSPSESDAPRAELLRGLAVLAEPPGPGHERVVEALGLPGVPTAADYSDVFLFQLYPYASVHLGPEGMLGGEARDRVAGFWRALGVVPPAEPDHLSVLLGLYASLAEREAELDDPPGRALLRRARAALLTEHLAPWVFAFLARVRELAPGTYGPWAALLERALEEERTRVLADAVDPPGLSAHLREAPPVSDPRHEGADGFLAALLAPVRSGVILTRADLARIASERSAGLRAGERRYALQHLLAQDAAGVLRALARECRRQAERVDAERSPRPDDPEAFLADRARETARLLDELADAPGALAMDALGADEGDADGGSA